MTAIKSDCNYEYKYLYLIKYVDNDLICLLMITKIVC